MENFSANPSSMQVKFLFMFFFAYMSCLFIIDEWNERCIKNLFFDVRGGKLKKKKTS